MSKRSFEEVSSDLEQVNDKAEKKVKKVDNAMLDLENIELVDDVFPLLKKTYSKLKEMKKKTRKAYNCYHNEIITKLSDCLHEIYSGEIQQALLLKYEDECKKFMDDHYDEKNSKDREDYKLLCDYEKWSKLKLRDERFQANYMNNTKKLLQIGKDVINEVKVVTYSLVYCNLPNGRFPKNILEDSYIPM